MASVRPRDVARVRSGGGTPLFRFSEAQLRAQLRRACAIDAPADKRPVEGGDVPGPSRQRVDNGIWLRRR